MFLLAAGALSLPAGGRMYMDLNGIAVFIQRLAGLGMHMLLLGADENRFGRIAVIIMYMLFHDTDKLSEFIIAVRIMYVFRHGTGKHAAFLTAAQVMEVFLLDAAGRIMFLFSADEHILKAVFRMRMLLVIAAHISACQRKR